MGTREHKKKAPHSVTVAIISVSTTRSITEDESGLWIRDEAMKEGHQVVSHQLITDDTEVISDTVQNVVHKESPMVLLITGGTGISPQDLTIEAVRPLFSKELVAFGPLFAQLSYEQIGSAALLSRATAGIINKTVVFCMPGSLKACRLTCRSLIFPELGHLAKHLKDE